MKTILKSVGTQSGPLGEFNFPVLESIEEAVELYGDRQALMLIQKSVQIDTERIAREMRKNDKSMEETQAAVDNWKPGTRGAGKPTLKTFLTLLKKFGSAGGVGIDYMLQAQEMYDTENVEAAVNFLRSKETEI